MTGGSLAASVDYVGDQGTGFFAQSGGTSGTSGGAKIVLGNGAAGIGTYHLNGGVLTVSSLGYGAGSATFNFSGGMLRGVRRTLRDCPKFAVEPSIAAIRGASALPN
jgi:hypothetical protein